MDSLFEIEGFGEVVIQRKKGVKRVTLGFRKNGSCTLTIPYFAPVKEAVEFAMSKKDWLISKKAEIAARTQKPEDLLAQILTFEPLCNLITINLTLAREPRFNARFSYDHLWISHPSNVLETAEFLLFVKKCVRKVLAIQAETMFPFRVEELAKEHGFNYKTVKINRALSRWGSCSTHKIINLSANLMLLPNHLIDFIILHELCHTVEMNHGPKFHQLLNKVTNNNEAKLVNELKMHEKELRILK